MTRLYIGIDFGWTSYRYEVRTEKNVLLKRGGGQATPEGLREVLSQFKKFKWVQVAYEAGTQMYWVHDVIREMGMDSYPFHAKSFVEIVKSKKKTDKKDAQKIAINAVKENLPQRVVVAQGTEKELRDLLKEREARKKDINALSNELNALAIEKGFRLKKRSGLSESPKKWEELIEQFTGKAKDRAKRLYCLALPLFQVLEEIEEEIRAEASEGEYGKVRCRMEKQPGMGFWTATTVLAWSGLEAEKFLTTRQAASYFGLVTSTRQSGDQKRLGKITKEGPPLVRKMMVQSAWAFIRSQEGKASRWGQWYTKEVERRPNQKKIIIVALARKLLTAAIASLKNHTVWDSKVLNQKKEPEEDLKKTKPRKQA